MSEFGFRSIDLSAYDEDSGSLIAKYGLPQNVSFCKRCIISNQRPNSTVEYHHTSDSKKEVIAFDEEDVCAACRQAEVKARIDWVEREKELVSLCDRYRKDDGSYDCLIPGSGGKDSSFASHKLKYKYGMHPLTVTWAPHMYTDWGWRNFNAWIHSGFDNYLATPNGKVHRLLTRLAIENLFHPFQPFMIGQKAFVPKMAAALDIPLIFYGENEAEYGNPIADNENPKRDWAYFTAEDHSKVFISGTSICDLKEKYGLNENDLEIYMPVNPAVLEERKIEVHYLGYYLKWHPQGVYYYAAENAGFQASPERTAGTYSKYHSIDDKIDDLHFYTTFIKFGIGRASYDAAQEIRNGEIERDEGVALVRKFDGEFPERFITELFEYLSLPADEFPEASSMFEKPIMDRDYFENLCEHFRSPHLWKRHGNSWQLRHRVFDDI